MLAAALEVEEARQSGMAEAGERLLASITTPDWCLVRDRWHLCVVSVGRPHLKIPP